MLIRQASNHDADGIASVNVRAWQLAYRGIVPDKELDAMSAATRAIQWREILSKAESVTWVAVENEEVLAFASVGPCRDRDLSPTTYELWALYVAPDHWRRGIGKRLWSAMKANVIPPGTDLVSLQVLAGNDKARRFYEKQGFETDGSSRVIVIGGQGLVEVRYIQKLH